MSRIVNVQEEKTFVPGSYDLSEWGSSYYQNPNNGLTGTSSTNYARLQLRSTDHIAYYNFAVTGIPASATIESVECKLKGYVTNSSYYPQVRLYSGNTAKGSTVNVTSTTSSGQIYDLSGGSWTVSELSEARIQMKVYRGSTQNARYFYFYGADLIVNYSFQGTAYTITATSTISGIEASPATQELMEGEDTVMTITGISDLNDVTVTDNDVDVTDQLEEHVVSGGTIERYPASYTTSGSINGTRYQSTVGHSVENPSTQSGSDYSGSSGTTASIDYTFDFSDIPEEAIIESVSVVVRGHLESTSQSNERAELRLYSGNTAKGSMSEFTSTSNQNITMTPGTWTREELQNAKLRFTIGYYGGLVVGVTWTVTYDVVASHYYTYTLSNLNNDHVILIDEAGAFIPPEEDPEYTYYPITISSINATTDPGTGTTRMVEGSNQTITIYPDDPLVTLILDNGTDVSSQLVAHNIGQPSYTVSTPANADYGFTLNQSTGYYVSTNDGVNKSASIARLNLDLPVRCLITIQYINYAEENYDYGMFGKIDTTVATDGLTAGSGTSLPSDSTSNYQLAKAANSASPQTITYEVESGEHFIDIKYGKDDATADGNDSLQWKIQSIEPLESNNYYTYTLTNIQQKHNLIFVFGDVSFYYVNSSGTACKLYPDGQFVELDGDNYKLTIVPDNINATVTILDNNQDRTSLLERKESVITKEGVPITYVSYTYVINNVSDTHNLVVNCNVTGTVYLKINGVWTPFNKIYKRVDDRWQEWSNFETLFDTNKVYYGTN